MDCALQRYTITADGRLLQHPGGGLFDEPPRFPTLEKDVELPIHGDIDMHESWSPSPVEEWAEYTVRFTHGRVEWIRPWMEPDARLLLANIKRRRARAEELLARCTGHWGYEDPVYRFYHQSYAALLHLFDLR